MTTFPRTRVAILAASVLMLLSLSLPMTAQKGYQKPPQEILDVLNAPVTPQASLSPTRDRVVFFSSEPYPPIAEISRPFARLAGLRIDMATNGLHNAPRFSHLSFKSIADGTEKKILLPAGAFTSRPVWSSDGKHVYFTHAAAHAIELWIADAHTGAAHAVLGVKINSSMSGGGGPGGGRGSGACDWMPGGKQLLCRTIPLTRGLLPKAPDVPEGPNIQESFGRAAPVATYEDLLENEQDSKLFEYLTTTQLALIDIATGKVTPVGRPGIFTAVDAAPDGEHILVTSVHRPYSYIVPVNDFPHAIDVWD